jgi:hypothetical protein
MEPRLPPGYRLELDADLLLLRRDDSGDLVAAFSALGADKESVERAAWADHLERVAPEPLESPT